MTELVLSPLKRTWIIDLDGTIVKHNGHLNGGDILLDGVREFFSRLPPGDKVIILTSRASRFKDETLDFLERSGIRFDNIIFDMPTGERILINDKKPSGLNTAYAVNKDRDEGLFVSFVIDNNL